MTNKDTVLIKAMHLGPERLVVLERWLPHTLTFLDRFHSTYHMSFDTSMQGVIR